MRKVTFVLLWIYTFSVPWDIIDIASLGTTAKLAGFAVTGAALITVLAEARFRKPDATLGMATAFVALTVFSQLWTIAPDATSLAAFQYVQMLGSVWVLREIARTKQQRESLMLAFCLGSFVPMIGLLDHYRNGVSIGDDRFSATGINADTVGMLMALGLPISWHLLMTGSRSVRAVGLIHFILAPLVLLLSGTRGAFLSALVSAVIVPLSLRPSMRIVIRGAVLIVGASIFVAWLVPPSVWARMATIPQELGGGSMSMRREIWEKGLAVFPQHAVLGIGAGAYPTLVQLRGRLTFSIPAHSVVIGLLVEQGILGLTMFMGFLGACALAIVRLPKNERLVWGLVMLSWSVGMFGASMERSKVSWLLFGLVSAQSDLSEPFRVARRALGTRANARRETWAAIPSGSQARAVSRPHAQFNGNRART
jgi:O-antigen ligase